MGDVAPVPLNHVDTKPRFRGTAGGSPPLEILFRKAVIAIGRIGLVECRNRLEQDLTPARAIGAPEPSSDGLFFRAETSSRHECARLTNTGSAQQVGP